MAAIATELRLSVLAARRTTAEITPKTGGSKERRGP
jgi:hypothetical protein